MELTGDTPAHGTAAVAHIHTYIYTCLFVCMACSLLSMPYQLHLFDCLIAYCHLEFTFVVCALATNCPYLYVHTYIFLYYKDLLHCLYVFLHFFWLQAFLDFLVFFYFYLLTR